MIAKSAIENFLNRKTASFDFMKSLEKSEIEEAVESMVGKDFFYTEPRLHQKICFLIGAELGEFLFLLEMGTGKALEENELVLTPKGYKKIKEIKVGDRVIGSDGKPIKVLGVYPQGTKDVYECTFSDRTSVQCCGDHLWTIRSATSKFRTLPLKEFKDELRGKNGWRKRFLPIVEPVQFKSKNKNLPLDPYLLGAWLGDGYKETITSADKQLIDIVSNRLPSKNLKIIEYGKYFYGITKGTKKGGSQNKNIFSEYLKEMGLWQCLSYEKFIPESYKLSSVEERLELLQGLIDTDGEVKGGTIQYTTCSKALAEDVQFIVQSLGGTASLRKSRFDGTSKYKEGKVEYFSLYIVLPTNILPSKLERKIKELTGFRRRANPPTKTFQEVSYVGQKNCICIAVDSDDGLFVTRGMTLTHNTKLSLDLLRYKKHLEKEVTALIVVPKVIHIENWLTEIKRHAPDISVIGLEGSSEERWECLENTEADAFIINYAGLVYMATEMAKKRKGKGSEMVINPEKIKALRAKFNFFIADEIQKAKNHTSLTYKVCNLIAGSCENRFGLTGTPFGRDPHDLWSQFHIIDRGKTLGPTLNLYREVFFNKKKNYWGGYEFFFKKQLEKELHELMKNRSIYYSSEECIDLPKRNHQTIFLKFPVHNYEYYRNVLESVDYQSKLEIERCFIKMRQIASGFLNIKNDEDDEVNVIDMPENPKLEALTEIIEDLPEHSKIVIFHDFIKSGENISNELTKLKIKHSRLYSGTKNPKLELERFLNRDEYKAFIINNYSGAEGLNLQVANYAVFYESPVSPIIRAQAEKRIHRDGQTKPCFIMDLVVENSIEEKILEFIKEGKDLFASLIKGDKGARKLL